MNIFFSLKSTSGNSSLVNLKNSFFLLLWKSISIKSPAPKLTTEDTTPTHSFFLLMTSNPSRS